MWGARDLTWCTETTSPRRTRRFLRTTLFMRILPSSQNSSARTMHTVSLRFLPLMRTVSPRKSCSSSIFCRLSATTELSSFTASSATRRGEGGGRGRSGRPSGPRRDRGGGGTTRDRSRRRGGREIRASMKRRPQILGGGRDQIWRVRGEIERAGDAPTMRRLGDFLRWRMAVDTSFFAPEPEGAAAASSAMSRRFAVERARSSDVVGKDTLCLRLKFLSRGLERISANGRSTS